MVEKTCANTLRLPFVDKVLPEARYLHIVRDGVDVVASAELVGGTLTVTSYGGEVMALDPASGASA